ncbi:unnamed protein product, partial [Ixodes hexagonus]
FQRHLTRHATDRPHACDVCGDTFKMKCHLAIHMHRHMPRSMLKKKKMAKKIIPKRAASTPQPLSAATVAPVRKKYECNECSFKTGIRRSLLVHQDAHRCSRRLKCKYCDYITLSRTNLLAHEARHPSQVLVNGDGGAAAATSFKKNRKVLRCVDCGYTSKYAGRLATHRKIHVEVAEPSNGSASLSNEDALKPFRCDLCGDCFKQKRCLTNHVNAHGRNIMFECTSCARLFKTKARMLAHTEEEHSGAAPPVPLEDNNTVPEEQHVVQRPTSPRRLNNGHDNGLGGRSSVPPVMGRVYCCLICPAELSSRQSLDNHMASDHMPRPASRQSSFYS